MASSAQAQPRADVNFAFSGATTNSANALDAFAAQDPTLAPLVAGIRAGGLDIIGVSQQLEFAAATLNDVNPAADLFWVYAGINNYLAGGQDPSVAPTEVGAALERLYSEVGARRFVVPNLPAIGDIPLFFAQPQQAKDGLNYLTVLHNQILDGVVAGFQAAHPDASVTTVDVFSVFQGHKVSGQFANTAIGCDMVLPREALAAPGACEGFLYLDIVHPASAAWAPVAEDVVDALQGGDVDRIITIGDSFSDLGSLSDTFLRTLGFAFPLPPFTEGRFTEAENVIQQVEALLAVETSSVAFAQPFRASESFTRSGTATTVGSVYVPKRLSGTACPGAKVKLTFERPEGKKVKCDYKANGEGTFELKKCNHSVSGGDLITITAAKVKLGGGVDAVDIDWLFY
jgi:phospholipase/lecithinase/hemolysin